MMLIPCYECSKTEDKDNMLMWEWWSGVYVWLCPECSKVVKVERNGEQ